MRDPEVVNTRNDLSGARPTDAIHHAQQSFKFTVIITTSKHKLYMPNYSQSNQPQTALLSSYRNSVVLGYALFVAGQQFHLYSGTTVVNNSKRGLRNIQSND